MPLEKPPIVKKENSERYFYEKAREKAQSFISGLNPEIEVSIEDVEVNPDDKAKVPYRTLALKFSHRSDENLNWTIEIEPSDDYIKNKLQNAVEGVYRQKIKRFVN